MPNDPPPINPPSPLIVQYLEDALAEAKAGNLRSIFLVAVGHSGNVRSSWNAQSGLELIGCVDVSLDSLKKTCALNTLPTAIAPAPEGSPAPTGGGISFKN